MNPRIPDTHAEAWALLPCLANGRIGLPDREWVEAHVQSCAECRSELASQRELATRMSQAGAGASPTEAEEEQQSFDKLWARVEASEAASLRGSGSMVLSGGRSSRTVRWLAAAVVVQAIGLGILGTAALRGGTQPFAANAAWTETGSTCIPSTIRPAVSRCSASAAPMIPGSRALIGGMALNRCVTPLAPSATACATIDAVASLWPIETRKPAAANARTNPGGTHSGASVTMERPTPASSFRS